MAAITPKTFYEWLMLLNVHRLKCGPLEAAGASRTHHALGKYDNQPYGFWDHQSATGYLDPDHPMGRDVKPAPPTDEHDPEWR